MKAMRSFAKISVIEKAPSIKGLLHDYEPSDGLFSSSSDDCFRFPTLWVNLSCPIADTEYEEPGGLQEKLERLNTMMGGTGAEHARRMQYLTHCEYTLG